MRTPAIPTAFLTNKDAPITVSAASENIFPTTGTKFPVIYLAVLSVIPSATDAVAPFTETTPRNTVKKIPNRLTLTFLNNLANWETLYLSDIELTIDKTEEKNINGNTTLYTNVPITWIKKIMPWWGEPGH